MISKASLLQRLSLDRIQPKIVGVPRLEFEQAIIRVGISFLVLAYVVWYVGRDGKLNVDEVQALLAAFAFFAFAVAIAVRIVQAPGIPKARRILGIVVDNTVASFGVFVLGEGGAVIVGLYLFVTLGNGFRYGRGTPNPQNIAQCGPELPNMAST